MKSWVKKYTYRNLHGEQVHRTSKVIASIEVKAVVESGELVRYSDNEKDLKFVTLHNLDFRAKNTELKNFTKIKSELTS